MLCVGNGVSWAAKAAVEKRGLPQGSRSADRLKERRMKQKTVGAQEASGRDRDKETEDLPPPLDLR